MPAERIFSEPTSTNGGENAAFTFHLLAEKQWAPQRIVLVQDPLMQRRSFATFTHHWQAASQPATFLNWPVVVPQLELDNGMAQVEADFQLLKQSALLQQAAQRHW